MSLEDQINIVKTALDNTKAWIDGPARGEFPAPDRELLVRARRTVGAAGREALEDFSTWLVEEEGLTPQTAERYAQYLWQAVIATGGRPLQQMERADITVSTKNAIRAAVRQFGVWQNDGELVADVENKRIRRLLKDRRNSKPEKVVQPLSDETLHAFMGALNADRGNPRRPWAWPCISIMVKLGLRARSDLCSGISKQAVDEAVSGAPLVIIGKRGTRRVVPSSIVHDELETLAAFPYQWGTVADIVAPASDPKNRSNAAYTRIRKAIHEYAETADIDPRELRTHRLRHTAALRLYEASGHDIMLVAGFLGHASIETTKNYLAKDRTKDIESFLEKMDFGESKEEWDDDED